MHSQQPPGVIQKWSMLQCSKQNTEQCGYDHAPVTRGRMRAQYPLPHGTPEIAVGPYQWALSLTHPVGIVFDPSITLVYFCNSAQLGKDS